MGTRIQEQRSFSLPIPPAPLGYAVPSRATTVPDTTAHVRAQNTTGAAILNLGITPSTSTRLQPQYHQVQQGQDGQAPDAHEFEEP